MESCHSVKVCELRSPRDWCRPPAHSILSQLISIIEKLRNRECAVPDDNPQYFSKLKEKTDHRMQVAESVLGTYNTDDMEITYGTNQSQQCKTAIGNLELELIKLQQNNECLAQENMAQHKRMKLLEQKLKPLQDKNKTFLDKNKELTHKNRSLEGITHRLTDEIMKLKDQCEQCKKKNKHLTQLLNQEKTERGELEIKYRELEDIKRQFLEQTKTLGKLKESLSEKERRINLVQHRKRKRTVLRSPRQMKYLKEMSGDTEADNGTMMDMDSPLFMSLDTSLDTLTPDGSCEEVQENYYRQLTKEHLQLQRSYSLLQKQLTNQELQLRSQLESDLFTSQCNIERLQTLLSQSQETTEKLQTKITNLKDEITSQRKQNAKLKCKLTDADERIETLEFQLVEYETTSSEQCYNDEDDVDDNSSQSDKDETSMMTESKQSGALLSFNGNKVIPQHMQSLEDMVRDLQVKVIQLQEENCRLEERLATARSKSLTLEEREEQEVLKAKEQVSKLTQTHTEVKSLLDHSCQTEGPINAQGMLVEGGTQTDCDMPTGTHQCDPSEDEHSIQLLQQEVAALKEENAILISRLQDGSFIQNEASDEEHEESFQSRLSEMSFLCDNLQERLNCSMTSEKQMKDKLKLAEDTINELETHEINARDMLEKTRIGETEARRRLSEAEQKISELKELVLDKDVYEMNLSEKVQFLEQAEVLSAQKISELEARNELLQQRLDLKEDLEEDVLLVETYKDKITILENENNLLNSKVAELEENEEILKNNWLKAAENDANRTQIYESKIKSLEGLNSELKAKVKELQEHSDVLSLSGPSLATELSESVSRSNRENGESNAELWNIIRNLEEELVDTRDKRDTAIESLQEKMAKLKENEVKLSESLMECEQTERELKAKLAVYEQTSPEAETVLQYEGKIKQMQNSREDLLDRLDSMEDHEVTLKKRLKETEMAYEQKITALEKEVNEYMQKEEQYTTKIENFEKHEFELTEKVKHCQKEIAMLKAESEKKSSSDKNDNYNQEIHRKLELSQESNARLEQEVEEMHEKLLNQESEIEQLRADNEDLNERLIELDSSEQDCMDKMLQLEQECKRLKHFREKCDILEEAENKLMERVTELEESEEQLRLALEYSKTELLVDSQSSSSDVEEEKKEQTNKEDRSTEDKETDTTDLVESPEQGRKLVGMYEHLQDVESQNQKLNEELMSLRGADNLNRHLSEKVKLLESSEDSLMERVMELEEAEDQLKQEVAKLRASGTVEVSDIMAETADLRKSVELLKVNLEMLETENEDKTEKIQEYVTKTENAEVVIAQLEKENSEYKEKILISEEKICYLETSLAKSEKTLKNEQEKIESFLKGEEKLFKSIASEKTRADELSKELSRTKESLTNIKKENEVLKTTNEFLETQTKGERKLSQSLELERSRSEDLECELASLQTLCDESKSDYEKKISQLEDILADVEHKEIKNLKRIAELSNQNQQLLLDNQRITELEEENAVLLKVIENNKSKQDNDPEEMEQDREETEGVRLPHSPRQIIDDATKQSKVEAKSQLEVDICDSCRAEKQELQMDNTIDEMSDGPHCVYCQVNVAQKAFQDCLRCKEEQEELLRSLQSQVEVVQAEKDELESKLCVSSENLAALESSNSSYLSENRTLQEKLVQVESELKSKEGNFLEKEKHLQAQIDSLRTSEKYLQQKLESVESAYGSCDNSQCNDADVKTYEWSPEEVNASQEELLSRIQTLERSNRSLECRLEYFETADRQVDIMLDKPEDILRQRILELEKLEKHLKIQVSDLEKDREELYEITRKDKNTIHEQNIRIHELQLTEKTVKAQIEKCETTERELYQKIAELEDQVTKMEDRISELTVLEMRLKKLVQKYKLDEEVWLSKSQDLSVSLSELTMSEAQLKQHVGNLEKEKMTLAEKSEYLELRLKEVENAEANLVQRAKDQENKEISLNNKLSEMQHAQSTAEMQVIELHNVNLDLSQRLNQVMQDNTVLNQLTSQLQNQVRLLEQQLWTLQQAEKKLKDERKQLHEVSRSQETNVKDRKLKEVDMEGKIQQLEEAESQLKEKLGQMQRNENRLQAKIRELESQSTLDLSKSQKERLPRKLEDCQRRILVLQNHNEELRELVNGSQGSPNNRSALVEQLEEMEQTVHHLQDTISQLTLKQGADGHRKEYEVLKKGLRQTVECIETMKHLIGEGQYPEGEFDNLDRIIADRNHLSYSVPKGEMFGPHADRRTRGQKVSKSKGQGRPVQRLANQMVDGKDKGRELLDDHSDASTVDEEIVTRKVQGKTNAPYPNNVTSGHHSLDDPAVSHLGRADMYLPPEEAHWMEVESRLLPPDSERWIQVGKATSVHTRAPAARSQNAQDQELVLGLTLASESEESLLDAQNDTDSSMWSPAQKRRKFRSAHSTDVHERILPQITPATALLNSYSTDMSEGEDATPHYMSDDHRGPMGHRSEAGRKHGSPPDSGLGTTSMASIGKQSIYLREKLAAIGRTLKKHSKRRESIDNTDSEGKVDSKQLANANHQIKSLKEQINVMERELEKKTKYITMLETFLDKLQVILNQKDNKPERELLQNIEEELQKTLKEAQSIDYQKSDHRQDVPSLNALLSRRERELKAKCNEVDSLLQELKQWQDECRMTEDMRTNALDAVRVLEMEVANLHKAEKELKLSQEVYNALNMEHKLLQRKISDLEVLESEHEELQSEVNRLKTEAIVIPNLQADNKFMEERLKYTTDLLDSRSEKVKNLLEEVSKHKSSVIRLEQDNIRLQSDLVGYENLKTRSEAMENSKEEALLTIAPLKARVTQLSQKCREKDDLLRRLGAELRKTTDVGQQRAVLEELTAMENRMEREDYNKLQSQSMPHLPRRNRRQKNEGITASMTDLDGASSSSSVADNQEYTTLSDTEAVRKGRTNKLHAKHPDAPWSGRLVKARDNRSLPHINTSDGLLRTDSTSAKQLPVGHIPPDRMFVAVVDYNPDLHSKSGRREAELTLKEWDLVEVIGPLDETGYYEAISNSLRGLVPAVYLRPANLSDVDNKSRTHRSRLHTHLNTSPERIIEVHSQLQNSHVPQHQGNGPALVNGNQNSPHGLKTSTSTISTSHPHNSSSHLPAAPRNFRIEKIINRNTIMLAWTPPSFTDNSYSNGVRVVGYKIYVNGKLHQNAQSPHIAKTIVKNLDTSHSLILAIQTIGTGGQASDIMETKLDRQDIKEDNKWNVHDSDVYRTGQKRSFVGIYDFVPSPGKYGDSELFFQAGDQITVYGEERMDGYYYGEINGKRGLVPGFFMEEIPPERHDT